MDIKGFCAEKGLLKELGILLDKLKQNENERVDKLRRDWSSIGRITSSFDEVVTKKFFSGIDIIKALGDLGIDMNKINKKWYNFLESEEDYKIKEGLMALKNK